MNLDKRRKDKTITVLIVDTSLRVRQTLEHIISSDPELTVITAADPLMAVRKIKLAIPDVITLEVAMQEMEGLPILKQIILKHSIPVILCSSLSERRSDTAQRVVEYGAVDIIERPELGIEKFFDESKVLICDTIKSAAISRAKKTPEFTTTPKLNADAVISKPEAKAIIQTTDKIVVIGASTGGTEALQILLKALPVNSPGIVIVQHMPERFTASFAKRLDSFCKVSIKEAKNNDSVIRGHVLIAPGNQHMILKRTGSRYYVELKDGPLVSRHRPSIDVLFRSAAKYSGKNAIGIIMTGMGDDGARGMLEMKQAGSFNISQDESTSVIFGMPKEAIRLGGVDIVLPLKKIAEEVISQCSK
ncbi:MAG: chemotaxis response regulator protein-glutamate methylesterase [Nitrospira sp.]|nr:chemotaxis response regulator protein-glutamate methylesterase [bacterium]MBL7047943.1 chemotaxis response regulator protein-glutamate methylesterase [Nitrospira sp.]